MPTSWNLAETILGLGGPARAIMRFFFWTLLWPGRAPGPRAATAKSLEGRSAIGRTNLDQTQLEVNREG